MVQTRGKVHQNPNAIRFVDRTAYIGRFVPRKSGVNRTSDAVVRQNELFKATMSGPTGCPAQAGGTDWYHFVKGLKECVEKSTTGMYKGGVSRSPAYHRKFNKYAKSVKAVAATA